MNLLVGWLFIVSGLSIVIGILFGIDIPILKIFFAGLLIYAGIKMLMPDTQWASYFNSWKPVQTIVRDDQDKYTVNFSSSVIDLKHLTSYNTPHTITIDTQCANVVVLLPQDVPVRVHAQIRFSSVSLPDGNMGSEYVNLHGGSVPALTIYINAQFAAVVVKE